MLACSHILYLLSYILCFRLACCVCSVSCLSVFHPCSVYLLADTSVSQKQCLEDQAANLRQNPGRRGDGPPYPQLPASPQALTPRRRLICPARPPRPPSARPPGSAQVAFPSCDPLREARGRGGTGACGGEWCRCMAAGEEGAERPWPLSGRTYVSTELPGQC